MKGKNWREYAPPEKQRKQARRAGGRRRRRGGIGKWLLVGAFIFFLGYAGFQYYYIHSKPYAVGLDAGHGGVDVGAVGVIEEVALTERTAELLENLLREDGRFRVVRSRKDGEARSITERNERFQKAKLDVVLSIHGNSSEDVSAYGFECYPSPPGYENNAVSLTLADYIAEEMAEEGARLRGNNGVRFGYYVTDETGTENKLLLDSTDMTVYADYDTFGILKNMTCAAVLVEQCFVTNAADVEAFGNEAGCEKAAAAYYRAICRYVAPENPANPVNA